MKNNEKNLIAIFVVAVISTLLLWLPFFLRLKSFWTIPLPSQGMATIMKNFDGPLYLIVAKSLYQPALINPVFSVSLSATYFAAHFPLYPTLIRLLGMLTTYPWAMLLITMFSSAAAGIIFYIFLKKLDLSRQPLWLTLVFLFFPARWFIVRSVGSPEPLFISLILLSILFFSNKKYWLAGIFGGLAQLTKSPGALLFVAYTCYLIWENRKDFKISKIAKAIIPLAIIPLSLTCLFFYYKFSYGDFFAYFHSGDNIHLFWPPFQIFNPSSVWVRTFWQEEIIYLYLISTLGVIFLFKQKKMEIAFFSLIFLLSNIFVAHRDLARYQLPLYPFLLIAFEPLLAKKEFKIAFVALLVPIYLYSLAFIANNTMPIADWAPYL